MNNSGIFFQFLKDKVSQSSKSDKGLSNPSPFVEDIVFALLLAQLWDSFVGGVPLLFCKYGNEAWAVKLLESSLQCPQIKQLL